MMLGLKANLTEAHHAATTWKFEVARAVAVRVQDPDKHFLDWLEHGAPMGLKLPILAGGHFPLQDPAAEIPLEELSALERCSRNHPSFDDFKVE